MPGPSWYENLKIYLPHTNQKFSLRPWCQRTRPVWKFLKGSNTKYVPGWYEEVLKRFSNSPTLVSCSMCVCVWVHASHGHHSHCTVIAVVRKWRDTLSQNQETPKTHYSHLGTQKDKHKLLSSFHSYKHPASLPPCLRLILCLLSTSLWPASYIRLF
jgi:hypothetical protein